MNKYIEKEKVIPIERGIEIREEKIRQIIENLREKVESSRAVAKRGLEFHGVHRKRGEVEYADAIVSQVHEFEEIANDLEKRIGALEQEINSMREERRERLKSAGKI